MNSPGSLSIDTTSNDRGVLMKLSGELDMANAPRLLAASNGHSPDLPLTVDLRGLSFLDSIGLSTLIKLKKEYPAGVRLVEGPPNVHQVFMITRCDAEFDWIDPSGEPRD